MRVGSADAEKPVWVVFAEGDRGVEGAVRNEGSKSLRVCCCELNRSRLSAKG